MDAFSTFYGADQAERTMFTERMFGIYCAGLLGHDRASTSSLPQLLWFRRLRLNQPALLADLRSA